MTEEVKWSETNVGKYSMFDLELNGIKTTISCDNENAKNLVNLFNELKHSHANMTEENAALKKQIESSIVLSEAEKSTLALMRKQIDGLIGDLSKKDVIEIIETNGGLKKLKELHDQGVYQKDIAKEWGVSASRISMYISEHGESWQKW